MKTKNFIFIHYIRSTRVSDIYQIKIRPSINIDELINLEINVFLHKFFIF